MRNAFRMEHPIDFSIVGDNEHVVATNGTTTVNVFGAKGAPFTGTITDFTALALDTTAGNITLAVNGNTVAVIAKGSTAGVVTGAGALSNTTFHLGDTVTLVSSSAGNARAHIYFTNT